MNNTKNQKKLVLIDFYNLYLTSVFSANKELDELSESVIKNYFIGFLLSLRKTFKEHEFIICSDKGSSWRKKEFPFYKAKREESRASNPVDWELVFSVLKDFKKEIIEWFPYKFVESSGCEADDVIAVLVKEFNREEWFEDLVEEIVIVSTDEDFLQLQAFENVKQYSQVKRKFNLHNQPKQFLFEKIITGDRGDCIPSIRNASSCILEGIRQVPVTRKMLDSWKSLEEIPVELHARFHENKKLIDLIEEIPSDISEQILEDFRKINGTNRKIKFQSYLIENRFRNFLNEIAWF